METSCPNSPFDEEHFEFVDYTAASQWERFITTVEEVLTGWGVNDGQLGIFDESRLSPLHDKIYIKKVGGIDPFVKRETIILDDNSYTLSYHYHPINQFLPLTLPNSSRDLSSVKLCEIHRWTGLTHILVLSLSDMFSFDSISKSSKIDLSTTKMLLSSFAIAFHNIKCKLPVFVPTGGLYNNPLYTGYMCLYKQEDNNDASDLSEAEIRFNTTYIRDVPTRYSNLESLTELFIEKMDLKQFSLDQTAIEHEIDKIPHLGITVSGLFTYELQNLDAHDWRRIIYDYDYVTSNRLSNNKDLTFDNDDVLLNKFNDKNETILGDLVLKNISGYSNPSNDQFSSSPDDSIPNSYLTSVLSEVTTSWCVDLDKGNLYGTKFFHKGEKQNQIYELPGSFNNYDLDSYNIKKTVPYKSFLWNLLECLLETISPVSNSRYCSFLGFLKILWTEVLKNIRSNWERFELIPDVNIYNLSEFDIDSSSQNKSNLHNSKSADNDNSSNGNSNGNYGISIENANKKSIVRLFERLTENAASPTNEDDLDFCDNLENSLAKPLKIPPTRKTHHINRPISNHHRSPSSLSNVHSYSPTTSIVSELSDSNLNGPSSLTESFIDIKLNYSSSMDSNQSYESSGKKARKDPVKVNNNSIQYGTEEEVKDENEREGHIHTHNGITLLKTGEQMWVPGTQDLGFMTEDMLYEQEQLLEKLETSERAKLQSAHLKSDMQAFKAANPHAILEDFIRWHSPKDWIPDDSGDPNKGKLSPRMMAEGNLWQELWMSAKRVPVKRQKPIFKYNGEAEKALHYLEHLQIHELFIQLLPTIFLIAYDTLLTNPVVRDIKPVASSISKLAQDLIRFPWNDVGLEYEAFSELIRSFKEIEMLMGKAFSLLRKLPKQYHLIERLLETPETQVLDGEERDSVYNLFMCGEARVSDLFPHPTTRELVLQATCLRPGPVPSRMYVSLNNDGMRIVDMVGKDTVFM
ncbi:11528_t:CDS:10 [Entrophospora sp. SA101]|nr:821_t:CDS:10 [Entrophospora sp. SA101]CAJ0650204.1 11528_t:CDS:10 [Entrophospora sp. SA101]CAJ0866801.1 3264_t:CDS:10 [Entrophospora sp. SA101]